MKQYWLEVCLDRDNVVKATFKTRESMIAAEEYAKSLMATSCSAKLYVKNREDFIKMLKKCAEIMEEES